MQTSSTETNQIEAYLSGTQHPEESLLFQAKLLLQPHLANTLHWQQKTYRLVHLYSQQQTMAELKEVENMLFKEPAYQSFRKKIFRLFNR